MIIAGIFSILLWVIFLLLFLVFGYAYQLWTIAAQQKGKQKTVGEVLAIIIAAITLIIFIALGIFEYTFDWQRFYNRKLSCVGCVEESARFVAEAKQNNKRK
ncbi:hypothetical protein ACFL52_04825 [Candidatus Margulisiibacteriota bacterium]